MPEENVKVAVRVRPFNKRERGRNATCIVEMNGAETKLVDPEGEDEPKKFAFDFSYWSFDGSRENANGYYEQDPSHPNGKKFCDQDTVFNDLGLGILKNAWGGFNSTLFAYGQTGSGKSWSVVGYGINKGIVPKFCETIFAQIDEKRAGGDTTEFQIFFSMLEIYNEEVRDLLISKNARGGLRVRENPVTGFYAQGLTSQPVATYTSIEAKMAEGTANRTVAATQMNATSSRAHTIVSITFVQKYKNAAGAETEKKAVCNLVDLAGSERAGNTGATGDRLKEGAAINLSLSSLGNCIAALADNSSGKKVRVPFRDSTLTKLLKNALGGNSKTVMIAAISPADINYEESLSTLRYADRAKQIKTIAVVNEDPTEKLIRDLQEENERLKKAIDSGGIELPEGDGSHSVEKTEGMSKAEEDAMKKQLAEEYEEAMKANEQRMADMQKNYEELLKQAEEDDKDKTAQVTEAKNKKTTHDYITNLNMDKSLTGYINHFLEDKTTVGNKRGSASDISLTGPSILEQHATFTKENGACHIEKTVETARLLVNGEPITEKTKLNHLDRIMFGTTQLYAFVDHTQKVVALPDFTDAMDEMAGSAGVDLSTEGKSKDELLIHDDILDILPMIEEANSLSEEMDKKVVFEPIIVPPEAQGVLKSKKSKVYIHVKNLENNLEVYWSREEFYARHDLMENLFGRFDDDDDSFDGTIDKNEDPFLIDENDDVHIGSFKVFLECLSYNVEMVERLEIIDYESDQIGECKVELHPCTAKGKVFKAEDDIFVDDPNQLLGQEIYFKLKLTKADGLPRKYKEVYAKFQLEHDLDPIVTKSAAAPKFEMNFEKVYSFKSLSQKDLEYLQNGCFMVQIWGKQTTAKPKAVNTKKAGQKMKASKSQVSVPTKRKPGKKADLKTSTLLQQAVLVKTRFTKFEKRIDWLKNLLREANKRNKKKVPTKLVIRVLEAKNAKEAKAIINSIGKNRGGGKDPHVEGPEEPRLEKRSGDSSSSGNSDSDDEAANTLHNSNVTFRLRL